MRSLEFVNKELHNFQELFFVKYFLDDYIKKEMDWYVEYMAGKRNVWSVLVKDRERMKEL
jgi:hypothetical protein